MTAITYRNLERMKRFAGEWRKAKIGAPNIALHLEAFLEGAIALGKIDRLDARDLSDLVVTLDDLNSRDLPALSDFMNLTDRSK